MESFARRPAGEALDAIAARDEAAAAGVGCALACATAAALVELTGPLAAKRVESTAARDDAARLRALGTRAAELRAAALRAADDDARAYAAVTEAASKAERAAALERASEPPLVIAESAAEVAAAAAEVAAAGRWPFTPDAIAACELAAAAARGAAGLVAANLSAPQDPRAERARDAAERAAAARDRLVPGG
jgi:formiminotetrahydrofolate cyclodeaminase